MKILRGKELAKEINEIAKMEGIDLSLADIKRTRKILSKCTPLFEEVK